MSSIPNTEACPTGTSGLEKYKTDPVTFISEVLKDEGIQESSSNGEGLRSYQSKVLEKLYSPVQQGGFIPFKSYHPGVILREEFMEGMDIMELSKKTGLKIKVIKPVTKLKAPVTEEIAEGLAKAFDTTKEFWLNLQKSYDDWYRRNLFKRFSGIAEQHNVNFKFLRGSNVGKSLTVPELVLCMPRRMGKTLTMECLKDHEMEMDRGIIAPRFHLNEVGQIDGPLTS